VRQRAPERTGGGRGSHRRNQHVPRHVLEEHRIARTAAAGAAGAVVLGAAFGLAGGSLGVGSSGNSGETDLSATRTAVDAALAERAASAPSRGLARAATVPEGSTILARAQAPETTPAAPTAPSGPPAAPLPPVPEDCEEYSGNRQIGCSLLAEFGFDLSEMPALDTLWTRESGWNEKAYNSSSGAYGIPQALPGSKMVSAGDDWETNPATQIRWGLGYIKDRYGTPTAALAHSDANGWY
jgi:hypothetical protein